MYIPIAEEEGFERRRKEPENPTIREARAIDAPRYAPIYVHIPYRIPEIQLALNADQLPTNRSLPSIVSIKRHLVIERFHDYPANSFRTSSSQND